MIDEETNLFFNKHVKDPHLLSPLVLAYIGDAVFELYVRARLITKVHKVQELHQHAVRYVKAASQSQFLARLQPHLSEEEMQIMRRGRNAKGSVPRNANVVEYRRSTGFETLIGYLYLIGETVRLKELLALIEPIE